VKKSTQLRECDVEAREAVGELGHGMRSNVDTLASTQTALSGSAEI
jgi:hypothetical protein